VSWKQAYDIRFSGGQLAEAAGLAYPVNWLAFVFFPLLMTLALVKKLPWLFVIILAGNILLYMTQGMKHILFASVYIPLMFMILMRGEKKFGLRIVWAPALFFIGFLAYVFFCDASHSPLAILLGANIVSRVFGMPGMLLGYYQAFFSDHPLTYYSHVTGVNWLIPYPYAHPIGVELGIMATGEIDNNLNANFWATDGLAAAGLTGVVCISMVMAFVFYGLDCISSSHKPSIVAVCLSQYIMILTNVSFFTSLVTGGLLWFFLIFYLMPPESMRLSKHFFCWETATINRLPRAKHE
jgi:hypothetical protein